MTELPYSYPLGFVHCVVVKPSIAGRSCYFGHVSMKGRLLVYILIYPLVVTDGMHTTYEALSDAPELSQAAGQVSGAALPDHLVTME